MDRSYPVLFPLSGEDVIQSIELLEVVELPLHSLLGEAFLWEHEVKSVHWSLTLLEHLLVEYGRVLVWLEEWVQIRLQLKI